MNERAENFHKGKQLLKRHERNVCKQCNFSTKAKELEKIVIRKRENYNSIQSHSMK